MSNQTLPTSPLFYARLVSTIGLGISFGLQASINAFAIPALFAVGSLSPQDRLLFWRALFDKRGKLLVPIELLLTITLTACAIMVTDPPGQGWLSSKVLLSVAAGATLASVPYTIVRMVPNVKRLKATQAGVLEEPPTEQAGTESDAGIKLWAAHNRVRVLSALVAFVAGALELALH